MSIADKITKLQTDVNNAYSSIGNKGGTIPTNKNTENLAGAIDTITGGGGGTPIYTVTFDSDGGSEVASQQIVEGYTAKEPTAPTKEYFALDYWALNGVKYDFSTPITSDITLNAVWKLPYTQLEYIESSGTQYINTGYIPSENAELEAQYMTLERQNYGPYIGGSNVFVIPFPRKADNKFYGNNNGTQVTFSHTYDSSTKYTVKAYPNETIIINGTTYTAEKGTKAPSYEFCLFTYAGDLANYKSYIGNVRIYYVKIWDNGELVLDLIPVIEDKNNTACMFDRISKKFLYNDGTGSFTAGPVV